MSAYAASVRSLSTRPSGVSRPQCPWSVNSSRHRSLITVSASPTSATTSVMARLRMPAGSMAPDPVGVLGLRDAEEHHAAQPQLGGLVGGLQQRRARVLDDARHRVDRTRLGRCPRARTTAAPAAAPRRGSRRPSAAGQAWCAAGAGGRRAGSTPATSAGCLGHGYFAVALTTRGGLALRRLGDRLHRRRSSPAGGRRRSRPAPRPAARRRAWAPSRRRAGRAPRRSWPSRARSPRSRSTGAACRRCRPGCARSRTR